MSVGLYMEIPGGTQEQYDAVIRKLGFDSPDAEMPQGSLSHFAGPTDNGNWCVFDEWETKEDFQRFYDAKLKKAMDEAGFGFVEPKWFRVYKGGSKSGQQNPMQRAA